MFIKNPITDDNQTLLYVEYLIFIQTRLKEIVIKILETPVIRH